MSGRRLVTLADFAQLQPMQPVASHPPEAEFQQWFADQRIDPREHEVYDFRRAYQAGVRERDAMGDWPSEFKPDNHPNLVVGQK